MNAVLESGKAVAGAVHAPRLQVFKWLLMITQAQP